MQDIQSAFTSLLSEVPAGPLGFWCGFGMSAGIFILLDILTPVYYKLKKWLRILRLKR